MMPNAEQSLIVCWRQLPAALRWRDTATFQNASFWVWFYAYSSIFIIAHANQGGSSWQAILICQHLWVATETRRPNYLCSIWQRLQKRPPTNCAVATPQSTPATPPYQTVHIKCLIWRGLPADWAGRNYVQHVSANYTRTINECDRGFEDQIQGELLDVECVLRVNNKQVELCIRHWHQDSSRSECWVCGTIQMHYVCKGNDFLNDLMLSITCSIWGWNAFVYN